MNKFFTILALILLACALPALADTDEQHKEMTPAQREQFHKELFEAKLAEMVYQLKITDAQKAKFTPIYSRYSTEMSTIFHNTRTRDVKDEAQKAKLRMQRQQQAQTLRLKYFDEFAKVLNTDQMSKLYTTEDAIQKKLKERRQRASKKH